MLGCRAIGLACRVRVRGSPLGFVVGPGKKANCWWTTQENVVEKVLVVCFENRSRSGRARSGGGGGSSGRRRVCFGRIPALNRARAQRWMRAWAVPALRSFHGRSFASLCSSGGDPGASSQHSVVTPV